MDISAKIRALRMDKGLTANEVATRLDITRSAYSNYEQGTRQPDYDTLAKICKLFGVSSDYILGLETEDGTKISIYNSFNNTKIQIGNDIDNKSK